MEREKFGEFSEKFDEAKLNTLLKEAWKIADKEAIKKYGKKVEKLSVEESKKIAQTVLNNAGIEKTQPVRLEYFHDISKALSTGKREETEDEEEMITFNGKKIYKSPDPLEDIGYKKE